MHGPSEPPSEVRRIPRSGGAPATSSVADGGEGGRLRHRPQAHAACAGERIKETRAIGCRVRPWAGLRYARSERTGERGGYEPQVCQSLTAISGREQWRRRASPPAAAREARQQLPCAGEASRRERTALPRLRTAAETSGRHWRSSGPVDRPRRQKSPPRIGTVAPARPDPLSFGPFRPICPKMPVPIAVPLLGPLIERQRGFLWMMIRWVARFHGTEDRAGGELVTARMRGIHYSPWMCHDPNGVGAACCSD